MPDNPARPSRLRPPAAAKLLRILLLVLAEIVVLGFAGLAASSYRLVQTIFTSPPLSSRESAGAPPACAAGDFCLTPISLTTSDGLTLRAYAAPSANGAALVLLHGYRSSSAEMLPIAQVFVRHGYGVILPDFRAHGGSEGDQVTFGRFETVDADAAFDYLAGQPDVDPARIGILGNSLGAGVAILYAADQPKVRAVVAQSPYTALADLNLVDASRSPGPLSTLLDPFLRFWIRERLAALQSQGSLDPIRVIARISPRPLFILMGGQDQMVDPQSGQRLYAAASDPKSLWFDPTVGHVSFLQSRPHEFEQKVVGFFDQVLK
jgi:dienelactone hydrolase